MSPCTQVDYTSIDGCWSLQFFNIAHAWIPFSFQYFIAMLDAIFVSSIFNIRIAKFKWSVLSPGSKRIASSNAGIASSYFFDWTDFYHSPLLLWIVVMLCGHLLSQLLIPSVTMPLVYFILVCLQLLFFIEISNFLWVVWRFFPALVWRFFAALVWGIIFRRYAFI